MEFVSIQKSHISYFLFPSLSCFDHQVGCVFGLQKTWERSAFLAKEIKGCHKNEDILQTCMTSFFLIQLSYLMYLFIIIVMHDSCMPVVHVCSPPEKHESAPWLMTCHNIRSTLSWLLLLTILCNIFIWFIKLN